MYCVKVLYALAFLFRHCPSCWAWTFSGFLHISSSLMKNNKTLVKVGKKQILDRDRSIRNNLLTRRYVQQQDENTENEMNQDEEKFQRAEYGVSYIGGDPCGSKYNDDPFDATSNRANISPGFPIDMKKRIEALAEKIKQQEKQ